MRGWLIFGGILLVLAALSWLRLGVRVVYNVDGLFVFIRLGPLYVKVYPPKPKREKPKRTKQPKPRKAKSRGPQQEEQKPGGALKVLKELIHPMLEAGGKFLHRLQVDVLQVTYVVPGAEDPAGAALLYGGTAAGVGIGLPVLENTFSKVKHKDISVSVDFSAREPVVKLRMGLSIRIYQMFSLGFRLILKTASVYFHRTSENNS